MESPSAALAAPTILAGVKTAAVINVGTATLGGFIGAGGYGRPILRGIDKFDVPLMLEGAIPAAVLALAVQGVFELAERITVLHEGALLAEGTPAEIQRNQLVQDAYIGGVAAA